MSATAKTTDTAPDQLDLYRFRDDLAHSYNPVNAHERMLVTQIAQAWMRLQNAYDVEQRYFQGRDRLDIIINHLDQFKAVTRYVTDCERAWRHAVLNLEQSQRRRLRQDLSSPNARRNRPAEHYPEPAAPPTPAVPPVREVGTARRE